MSNSAQNRIRNTLGVVTAILLLLPSPVFAGEWSGLVEEVFSFFATCVAGINALGVLIALFCIAFRSRRALRISFALSGITTVAFLLALAAEWEFLLKIRQTGNEQILHILIFGAMFVIFAWLAPLAQFLTARRPPSDKTTKIGS